MNQLQLQCFILDVPDRLSIGFCGKAPASSRLQPVALVAVYRQSVNGLSQYQLTVSVSVLERLCEETLQKQRYLSIRFY